MNFAVVHIVANCQVLHSELFAKIPSMPLVVEIVLFQSIPKIL